MRIEKEKENLKRIDNKIYTACIRGENTKKLFAEKRKILAKLNPLNQ